VELCSASRPAQISQRGGPGSIPDHVIWDMWRTKWHWDGIRQSTSVSSASSHSGISSALINNAVIDAVQS
jgi:hypothetical protein